ncbi:hypothetical protein GOM49_17100 [Clostridium bovifaecis]|uniref:Uncharacterized protein n=1 Tax=Clostridium bovifaecis TaxID=2184719 RepID=A0A6I6F862_9CLOT|nr:hypothetical protein GOM49_17100 [Clostridium bovifaecis]
MFNDIITIVSNIFLGMSLVGTGFSMILFITIKIFKLSLLNGILSKTCILFIITWIIFIACSIYLVIVYPSTITTAMNYFKSTSKLI